MAADHPFARVHPIDDDHNVSVVIDTPKGSRNKYKYDESLHLYRLASVLPAGASFPYNFGFVPGTLGEDGDPLDILILMDDAAFVGCLVPSRLIGVIEAEQTEEGKTIRNDRLIAVAAESRDHHDVRALGQISANLVGEIEHFFISYNELRQKCFEPLGRAGPERALALLKRGVECARAKPGK
jgi:inorganic pyrophosphatase